MAFVEQTGNPELQWDWARIQRSPQGRDNAWVARALVTTTAVNTAVFALVNTSNTPSYIYRLTFNPSAQINWIIYASNVNPGLAVQTAGKLGATANAPGWQFQAGIGVAPALLYGIDEGTLPARSYTRLIDKDFLSIQATTLIFSCSAAVSDNQISIMWTEYDD